MYGFFEFFRALCGLKEHTTKAYYSSIPMAFHKCLDLIAWLKTKVQMGPKISRTQHHLGKSEECCTFFQWTRKVSIYSNEIKTFHIAVSKIVHV